MTTRMLIVLQRYKGISRGGSPYPPCGNGRFCRCAAGTETRRAASSVAAIVGLAVLIGLVAPAAGQKPDVTESATADPAHWPAFSWDTVPVYIHFGKSAGPLTEQELAFVARTSDFVCLEKAHGTRALGSTEKGTAHDAARLKALNPRMKVLFYWNTFLNYHLYDACEEVAKHPEWLFRDKEGQPIYKVRNLEQYNLLDSGFRAWWATVAGKAVKQYGCDGIFMDAVDQAKRPLWMKKGWGAGKEPQLTGAVNDMMRLARREMGDGAIVLYNGLRSNANETAGFDYLAHADGAMVEHFTAFASQSKEAVARDIAAIIKAGEAGKIVAVKGWPDPTFNWTNTAKMRLPQEQLAAEARKKITFSLACYLVAARRHSYFCYSWGYTNRHGNLIDYPEFHKPLGPPSADAERDGWVYTRSFEHASVRVNLANREAKITWKGK